MEPATIAAAAAAASHVKNLFSGLVQAVKATGKSEVMEKFIDAQAAMMDLLQKQNDLIDRVRELEDGKGTLKAAADLRSKMKFNQVVYVIEGADTADGTYCPTCYDADAKLIRLHRYDDGHERGWRCCNCNRAFCECVYNPLMPLNQQPS